MKRFLYLPRDLVIDIDNVPENLEELVQKAFGEYTEGTSSDYTDEDRLCFIDCMMEKIHRADPWDKVDELIIGRFKYELQECGNIMDPDEFYGSREFFADCYELGQKDAQLRFRCDDHHISDKVNPILVRVIRAVMSWKQEVPKNDG